MDLIARNLAVVEAHIRDEARDPAARRIGGLH